MCGPIKRSMRAPDCLTCNRCRMGVGAVYAPRPRGEVKKKTNESEERDDRRMEKEHRQGEGK